MSTGNQEAVSNADTQYTPLQYALAYAKLGWPVVPLHTVHENGTCTCGNRECGNHVGKHPRIKDWTHRASTDETQIREWWGDWPDANIGILTGKVSGVLALDIDPRNGGEVELQKLVEEYGELPNTPTVSTGGGGLHYYLRMPGFAVKNMCGDHALRPGVEIRSDSGMVVAPPGKHASGGGYEWLVNPAEAELAPVPGWLEELLVEAMESRQKATKKSGANSQGSILDGERNATLTRIAGGYRGKGYSEGQILSELIQINQKQCVPPLPESEVRQIAGSVSRYPAGFSNGGTTSDAPVVSDSLRLTDLGNAERLIRRFGHMIRYCAPWKQWLVWDGKRWTKDTKQQVRRYAYQTVRGIYDEAGNCPDDAQRQALAKHALASEAEKRIKAMISLAQALPGVAISPDEMDTDLWLINVANGTLELRTGELRAHNPLELLTKLANVAYYPDEQCPTWLAFLDRIMAGNQGLIRFLQKAIGYALTGDVSEQAIFFLYGNTGKNGKSTFLNTIKDLLGDYGQSMQPETLMVKNMGRINNDIARLHGARFVAAIEGEEGQRLSESLIKQMTGGDIITARFLHQEYFDFQPTHKIFFGTNHKPVVRGTDDAIWRRIRLIPFKVTIPEEERDNHLPEKLKAELPGILRWAVEGCLLWQTEGLGVPPEVADATNEYRGEMDIMAKFVADCCVEHPSAHVASSTLYEAYLRWCNENGERSLNHRQFADKLKERGHQPGKSGSTRRWKGIGLAAHVSLEAPGTLGTHRDVENNKTAVILPFVKKNADPMSSSVPMSHPTPTNHPGSEEEWEEGTI